jgi:hypothetical protein
MSLRIINEPCQGFIVYRNNENFIGFHLITYKTINMNEGFIAIIGGFAGSALTVIITKILELIQKDKEFKYDLKKQFFTKKLQAGETAIIQYTGLCVALQQLSTIYNQHEESQTKIGQNLKDNLLKQLDNKLLIINSSSFELANSINLYFDLKSNFSEGEIIPSVYDKMNVEECYEIYLKENELTRQDEAYEKYEIAYDALVQAMKDIGSLYKNFENEIRGQIKQIRNEMKKYE